MCHANLDPKFLARDVEARVKGLSFKPDDGKEPERAGTTWGWIGAILARLIRREAGHV